MKKIMSTGVLLLAVALLPQLALGQTKKPAKEAVNIQIQVNKAVQKALSAVCPVTNEKEISDEQQQELINRWMLMMVNIGHLDYTTNIYNEIRDYINQGGSLSYCQIEPSGKINTLLSQAVEKQDELLVRLLLSTDISADTLVNYKTGETVLMRALQIGNKDIIDSLIRAGADVTAKDVAGHDMSYYMDKWKNDVEKMLSK